MSRCGVGLCWHAFGSLAAKSMTRTMPCSMPWRVVTTRFQSNACAPVLRWPRSKPRGGENAAAQRGFLHAAQRMLAFTHDTDARLLDVLDLGADLLERGVVSTDDLFDVSALRGALAEMAPDAALHETVAVLRGGADGTPRDENVLPARLLSAAIRERLLGADHPSLGASLALAGAVLYHDAGQGRDVNASRVAEAAAMFRRAIPLQIAANGPDSPLVGKSYEKLATCMVVLGELHQAARWYARDCELWMRQPAGLRDDYQVLIRARWTAWHATRAGEYETGLQWTDQALEVLARTLGLEDGGAALIHACRAECYAQLGRGDAAQASAARAQHILSTQPVPDDQRMECGRLLGSAHLRLGKPREAGQALEPAWQGVQTTFEHSDSVFRLEWSRTMLQYVEVIGDQAKAEKFAECIRKEATGDFRSREAETAP